MKRIICIGHAALDHVYRIEAFPAQPAKVRALEHIDAGGGMAANAAAAIARLGGKVELWSHVGSDEAGRKILDLLRHEGIATDFVQVVPGARSSTAAVIVDAGGERLIVGERDHGMAMEPDWLPLDRIAEVAVIYSDLRWFEGTRAAFTQARRLGVPTLLDADLGGSAILNEFLGLADYVIFSRPALELFETGRDDRARLQAALARGPRHAGVTDGAKGYFWMTRDGIEGRQDAFKVEAADTTGAGDAFHGAFAWGLAQGSDDKRCARIASAVAALSCRKLGARAGLPTRVELDDFLSSRSP